MAEPDRLPITDGSEDELDAAAKLPNGYRVLVVEDDELIRISTAELMRELGHEVLEAHSAELAMAVIRSQPVDVLFTDVALPGVSGDVFAAEACAVQPGLRIVFATGTDRIPDVPGGGNSPVLLRKPYDGAAIAAALAGRSRSD